MNKVEKIITITTLICLTIIVGVLVFFTLTKAGRQFMSDDWYVFSNTNKTTSEYTLKESTVANIKITKQND